MWTFHKILVGCEEGSRAAWQEFLTRYTPVILELLAVYAPTCGEACRKQSWHESLSLLGADSFQHLRTFDHQSEREFMVDVRSFVLARASNQLDPGADTGETPAPKPETVKSLVAGLPLVHQLVLFLKLAGYSDRTLERILRITPTLAQQGLQRLEESYVIVLQLDRDAGLWPAAWMNVLREAWAAKTAACPPLRQLVRILDGQTSWNEKDSVEKHVVGCLHCLERWTALREVVYWMGYAKQLCANELDAFITSLPLLGAPARVKKSIWKRMFD